MKRFDQKKFNTFVMNNDIFGFFPTPIKLVSGRTSCWYVNWRTAMHDAVLMDMTSDFLLSFLKHHKIIFDCLYGIPEGTTKLATITQYKMLQEKPKMKKGQYVYAMGRKQPKDHGDPKDRFFVGQPKGDVVVLEDVTTTGQSVYKHVQILKDFGANVVAAVTLTNRNELRDDNKSIAQALKEVGVPYIAMSNALDLLPKVAKKFKLSARMRKSIVNEFVTYGEQEIQL